MDTHCAVEIFFADSLQESASKSLRDFTSIGAQVMESDDLIVIFCVDYHLSVAILSSVVVQ